MRPGDGQAEAKAFDLLERTGEAERMRRRVLVLESIARNELRKRLNFQAAVLSRDAGPTWER